MRTIGALRLIVVAVVALLYPSAAFASSGWSEPVGIDTTQAAAGNYLSSVSCPSASFCAAVDNGGNALTYQGTVWSAPVNVDSSPTPGLPSVSCASASFCVAVGTDGGAYTYNGSSWSGQAVGSTGLNSVSCPSASFCVAVGNDGNAHTYNGSSWTPATVDSVTLYSVSCPTSSFCAVVSRDNAYTYNGSSWSAPATISSTGEALTSVSCPSASFCAAAGDNGNAYTYNGSSWSEQAGVANNPLISMSCPSASFCVALDQYHGNAYTYSGASTTGTGGSGGTGGAGSSGQPPATAPTSGTFGGLTVTVRTPAASACVADGKRLNVSLSASAKHPGLEFKSAKLFIDKGIKHTKTERRRLHGTLRTIKVTVYLPNATARHVPVTLQIAIKGLTAGSHELTVKLTLTQKLGRKHGVTVTRLIHKTLRARFTVC